MSQHPGHPPPMASQNPSGFLSVETDEVSASHQLVHQSTEHMHGEATQGPSSTEQRLLKGFLSEADRRILRLEQELKETQQALQYALKDLSQADKVISNMTSFVRTLESKDRQRFQSSMADLAKFRQLSENPRHDSEDEIENLPPFNTTTEVFDAEPPNSRLNTGSQGYVAPEEDGISVSTRRQPVSTFEPRDEHSVGYDPRRFEKRRSRPRIFETSPSADLSSETVPPFTGFYSLAGRDSGITNSAFSRVPSFGGPVEREHRSSGITPLPSNIATGGEMPFQVDFRSEFSSSSSAAFAKEFQSSPRPVKRPQQSFEGGLLKRRRVSHLAALGAPSETISAGSSTLPSLMFNLRTMESSPELLAVGKGGSITSKFEGKEETSIRSPLMISATQAFKPLRNPETENSDDVAMGNQATRNEPRPLSELESTTVLEESLESDEADDDCYVVEDSPIDEELIAEYEAGRLELAKLNESRPS